MEIANVEQAQAWDGREGDQWTEQADRYEAGSARIMEHLHLAKVVRATDAVLDIGCGTGLATLEAARVATAGDALGIDLSSRMLAYAAQRAAAEGVTNVRYQRADAQVHPFEPESVDALISGFGVMFFGDPAAAWANLARALRPGGQVAVMAWRRLEENEWLMSIRGALALGRELGFPPPDAPTPFSLAAPDRVHRLFGDAGLLDVELTPVDEPMVAGRDADHAYEFISGIGIVEGLLEGVDDAGRAEGLANLRRLLKEAETSEGVLLPTASWLITATRS
jgi:SAM-dependent methyltransferase